MSFLFIPVFVGMGATRPTDFIKIKNILGVPNA